MMVGITDNPVLRAPTTGGQYHWVSEFAPREHQKFLSYLMGWLCVLGWQTSVSDFPCVPVPPLCIQVVGAIYLSTCLSTEKHAIQEKKDNAKTHFLTISYYHSAPPRPLWQEHKSKAWS